MNPSLRHENGAYWEFGTGVEIRLAASVNYAREGTCRGSELGKGEGIEKGFLGEIDYGAVRIKLYVNSWISIT
jgi:hypothetical protein